MSGRGRSAQRIWTSPIVLTSVVAALFYSNFVLDWVLRGFEGMNIVVSHLSAPGEPNATVVRLTDFACGVLVLTLLPSLRRALPAGPWRKVVLAGTAVFAVSAALAAVVTSPCGADVSCTAPAQQAQRLIHNTASTVSDVGLYIAMAAAWFMTRRIGPRWFTRAACWLFWVGGVVATTLFGLFAQLGPTWATGASQRVHIGGISLWILCLGLFAATSAHRLPGLPDPGGITPGALQRSRRPKGY